MPKSEMRCNLSVPNGFTIASNHQYIQLKTKTGYNNACYDEIRNLGNSSLNGDTRTIVNIRLHRRRYSHDAAQFKVT